MSHKYLAAAIFALFLAPSLHSQTDTKLAVSLSSRLSGAGHIVVPQSSVSRSEDRGLRAQTQFKIHVPAGHTGAVNAFSEMEVSRQSVQPISGYYAETPASLLCIYGLVTTSATACNPSTATAVGAGGSKAIAIVDAYDYPTALADLTAYSKQFGLPAPSSSTFTVAYQGATKPPVDPYCAYYGGWDCWAAEAALDVEMAHAMAPSAHVYLVEANSSSFSDLFAAVTKAVSLVQAAGGGEVSMSWGGSEFSTETAYDTTFAGTNVTFFASSGDSEGTIYPSASPNVVAVGGTTVSRNPSTLAFQGEIAWEDAGGGYSSYETRPTFQSSISSLVGAKRGVPDVAAIANPRTGVWVYMSYDNTVGGVLYPWNIFGGTSVAAPVWAGIVNRAGHFYTTSAAELTAIYANAKTTTAYRDVSYGTCGYYEGWSAVAGWDPCTGLGAPLGTAGK